MTVGTALQQVADGEARHLHQQVENSDGEP